MFTGRFMQYCGDWLAFGLSLIQVLGISPDRSQNKNLPASVSKC